MSLAAANKEILDKAIKAIHERVFYAQYPEHPKSYGEDAPGLGLTAFNHQLGQQFKGLLQQNPVAWEGEEVSPYTLKPLGITYPVFEVETLIVRAGRAFDAWRHVSVDDRAEILVEALEKIKYRFF